MNTTVSAGMSLNSGALVNDVELVLVGSHLELVLGDNTNDGEEGALGLPALGAAAGVVVGNIARKDNLNRVALAVASTLAAFEIVAALGEAVVDRGVKRDGHFSCLYCFSNLCCDDSS